MLTDVDISQFSIKYWNRIYICNRIRQDNIRQTPKTPKKKDKTGQKVRKGKNTGHTGNTGQVGGLHFRNLSFSKSTNTKYQRNISRHRE